ncbi:MAG: histidinol-phosphatase [Cytophagaceae bacterium]|nr:MAG: histidinol-phosphatase [Cytophagaceae bacterium]
MSLWQTIRQAIAPSQSASPTVPADACFWRVDMHSHLIAGVDDGVSSLDESLVCMQKLAAWGIEKVITTPHVSRDWYPNRSAELRAGCAELQAVADDNGLNMTVEVAAEYMLDEFFPELVNDDDLLTFGAERYVLVEMGWAAAPRQTEDLLFRMQTKGYTPVLAHPERYAYLYEDNSLLTTLHENGCLFQLNWMSVAGRYGERAQFHARQLLKKEWVDFIGSDMHRPVDLKAMETLFSSVDYELLKKQPLRNESLR